MREVLFYLSIFAIAVLGLGIVFMCLANLFTWIIGVTFGLVCFIVGFITILCGCVARIILR